MQCVILAGGLGTRMRPQTEKIPKSLLPVKGEPFLKYQLEWLKRSGISDVVLCLGYLGEMVEAFARKGEAWNLPIRYVHEGRDLRGTAGALRLAFDEGKLAERFFVLYGDSYLPVDLQAIADWFERRPEPALMTVLKNDEKWDNSNACFDGNKVTLYQKGLVQKPPEMRYIDYGLTALRRTVVAQEIPGGVRSDLAELFNRLSVRGELAGYEVKKRFFEIGSPAGLADFEAFIDGKLTV